ncbi:MAG: Hpt domain-containing protein [Sulfitobacter litoralis]|nr:Hpt domain-containing protein [Sulfitobacter litoralis]MBQ0716132.1 Hpt domain-containing protein [Sulfitobacter litoralis]MBQ0801297.1 Hpt domain-containing protein [Sulfitobacter litoralis]
MKYFGAKPLMGFAQTDDCPCGGIFLVSKAIIHQTQRPAPKDRNEQISRRNYLLRFSRQGERRKGGESLIDWEQITLLNDAVGPNAFEEIIVVFFLEVEEAKYKLRDSRPTKTTRDTLHFVKGSALSLGFIAFSEYCLRAEKELALGNPMQPVLEDLFMIYEESKLQFSTRYGWKSRTIAQIAPAFHHS